VGCDSPHPIGYGAVPHCPPHPPSKLDHAGQEEAPRVAGLRVRRIGRAVNGEMEEEVVLRVPEPWEEGEPDYDAPWLSADTEFKLLNDGGSDEALVCVQVSDGVRSKLYRFDDIRRVRERLRGAHVYAHNISADARNMGIDLYDLESWDDTGLMAYVLRYPRVGLKDARSRVDWDPYETHLRDPHGVHGQHEAGEADEAWPAPLEVQREGGWIRRMMGTISKYLK
jgi:hypothetical protein